MALIKNHLIHITGRICKLGVLDVKSKLHEFIDKWRRHKDPGLPEDLDNTKVCQLSNQ